MFGKILKYLLRGVLVVVLLLALLPALLYVPGVQRRIVSHAEVYLSRSLGMDLSIGRIRLAFPLHLTVDRVVLLEEGDTLLRCGRLETAVAPLPLLRGEVAVRMLDLSDFGLRYADSLAGMRIRAAVGRLTLWIGRVDLRKRGLTLFRADLARGDVDLGLEPSAAPAPKNDTAALPWRIAVGRFTVANTAFRMRTAPEGMALETTLVQGTVEGCDVDLAASRISVSCLELDRGAYLCRMASGPAAQAEPSASVAVESAPAAVPWQVRVARITLRDNRVACETAGHRPVAGLIPKPSN